MTKINNYCAIAFMCLLLSGCGGYETLPLAKDSQKPDFYTKLTQGTPIEAYFCFSDWGEKPFVKLVFTNSAGERFDEKFPITDWSWYYPEYRPENPIWMTILGSKELYHSVPGTQPCELTVISENELKDENTNKPLEATGVPAAPQR